MLDLQAGIHLDEVMAVAVDEELHRPRAGVGGGARELERIGADAVAQRGLQIWRRRNLDHFLVPPLHRAVALVQMHDVAVQIAEELHLDVAHVLEELFQKHDRAAKGAFRFRARLRQGFLELVGLADDAHAAPTATVRRFHQHRGVRGKECPRRFQRVRVFGRQLNAGHDRNAGLPRKLLRLHLVAHQRDHRGSGPDEADAALFAGARESRVLREEAITRMDRVYRGALGCVEDLVDSQIGVDRPLSLADEIRLVRLVAMLVEAVLLAVDGDGPDAEFVAGAEDANGDLAAIRAEHLGQRLDGHGCGRA